MNATVVSDRVLHVSAIGARLIMAVGGAYCPTVLGERFPRHPAAFLAGHDAPHRAGAHDGTWRCARRGEDRLSVANSLTLAANDATRDARVRR